MKVIILINLSSHNFVYALAIFHRNVKDSALKSTISMENYVAVYLQAIVALPLLRPTTAAHFYLYLSLYLGLSRCFCLVLVLALVA